MMSALQCQLQAQKVGSSILPARTHHFLIFENPWLWTLRASAEVTALTSLFGPSNTLRPSLCAQGLCTMQLLQCRSIDAAGLGGLRLSTVQRMHQTLQYRKNSNLAMLCCSAVSNFNIFASWYFAWELETLPFDCLSREQPAIRGVC